MSETNDGFTGGGQGYQPRHAAKQLDEGFMETLAGAADNYRYGQIFQEIDAKFAIVRARLFGEGEGEERGASIDSQRQLIAESIGKQAMAKEYADSLRGQLYYAPPDGVYYHGRHRKEDRPPPGESRMTAEPTEAAVPTPPIPENRFFSLPASWPPQGEPGLQDPWVVVPVQGRLRHIIAEDDLTPLSQEAGVASEELPPAPEPAPPLVPPGKLADASASYEQTLADAAALQRELSAGPKGFRERAVAAWRRFNARIATYFYDPERGGRRRLAALAIGVVAVGTAGWLIGHHVFDRHQTGVPPVVEPPAYLPHTDQPDYTPLPGYEKSHSPHYHYYGQSHEWSVIAEQVGASHATPELLGMIRQARAHGVHVETWGDPACGQWGITKVTVHQANCGWKSYYDTAHKLAILKRYAS